MLKQTSINVAAITELTVARKTEINVGPRTAINTMKDWKGLTRSEKAQSILIG